MDVLRSNCKLTNLSTVTNLQSTVTKIREHVQRKRPDMWKNHSQILYQDSLKTFLAKHGISMLKHPPCLPDILCMTIFLFPKVKVALKGTCFAHMERSRDQAGVYIVGDKVFNVKDIE